MLRQSEQTQALTAGQGPRALPEKADPGSGPDPQPQEPARPWWKLWGSERCKAMAELPHELAPDETCLRCGSRRVSRGLFARETTFLPLPLKPAWNATWAQTHFYVYQNSRICLACGLRWGSIDTEKATRVIRAHGADDLKHRVLDVPEALPIPAAAPTPDAETLPLPADPPALNPDQLPRPQEP